MRRSTMPLLLLLKICVHSCYCRDMPQSQTHQEFKILINWWPTGRFHACWFHFCWSHHFSEDCSKQKKIGKGREPFLYHLTHPFIRTLFLPGEIENMLECRSRWISTAFSLLVLEMLVSKNILTGEKHTRNEPISTKAALVVWQSSQPSPSRNLSRWAFSLDVYFFGTLALWWK